MLKFILIGVKDGKSTVEKIASTPAECDDFQKLKKEILVAQEFKGYDSFQIWSRSGLMLDRKLARKKLVAKKAEPKKPASKTKKK